MIRQWRHRIFYSIDFFWMLCFVEEKKLILLQIITQEHLFYTLEVFFIHNNRPLTSSPCHFTSTPLKLRKRNCSDAISNRGFTPIFLIRRPKLTWASQSEVFVVCLCLWTAIKVNQLTIKFVSGGFLFWHGYLLFM